jgi:hypothetical protein
MVYHPEKVFRTVQINTVYQTYRMLSPVFKKILETIPHFSNAKDAATDSVTASPAK